MTFKELQAEVRKIIGEPSEWTDKEIEMFLEEAKRQFREAGFEV